MDKENEKPFIPEGRNDAYERVIADLPDVAARLADVRRRTAKAKKATEARHPKIVNVKVVGSKPGDNDEQ